MGGAFEPRLGPFRLASNHIRDTILAHGLVCLLWMTAVVFGVAGAHSALGLLETYRIWIGGVEATGARLQGEVGPRDVFKDYTLELQYQTATGEAHQAEVEFFRFVSGPELGDAHEVRYLESDPTRATISWAVDATLHEWFYALVLLVTGGVGLLAIRANVREAREKVQRLKRLAQSGRLVACQLTGVQHELADWPRSNNIDIKGDRKRLAAQQQASQSWSERRPDVGVGVVYTFVHEKLHEPTTYKANAEAEVPWIVDERSIVVLVEDSTGEHLVLQADGYPLVL